jgi:hypothetical protein
VGEVLTGTFWPLVPLPRRLQVFDHLHCPAHPGHRATHSIISFRYVWCGLVKDMTAWATECYNCQKGKVHVQLRPHHMGVPAQRFSRIHVDLVGPLPVLEGATYKYLGGCHHNKYFPHKTFFY